MLFDSKLNAILSEIVICSVLYVIPLVKEMNPKADVDSSVNFKYGEIGQYVVIAMSEYNFCVKLYRKPAAPEIEPFFASVVSSCQVTYILSNELTVDDKEIIPDSLSYFAFESNIPFLYTFTEFSAIFVPTYR